MPIRLEGGNPSENPWNVTQAQPFTSYYRSCCASFVTLVKKIEVLSSSVGSAEQDNCKEKELEKEI
jgi:hypothetical protein